MTETPEPRTEPTTVATATSRWDERRRPLRLFKLAAFVVIAAGIVFIFAVVFWTGMMIGAHGGGHHHGHHQSQGRTTHSQFQRHQWQQSPGSNQPGVTAPGGTPSPSTTVAPTTTPARP
ncbi:MAG: hypothetical protein JO191_05495 [Mycobacteriaceae bacterium]|nr:hypothetical protein [Mycobacteriaceae bacterium]MBV9513982.1 hypothetical protein [Mycobacteriaceae bacterium]